MEQVSQCRRPCREDDEEPLCLGCAREYGRPEPEDEAMLAEMVVEAEFAREAA